MSGGSWRDCADQVLAELFVVGKPAPTREEIRDAYPFGERAMWPYKVWCLQVKRWARAHAAGRARPDVPLTGARAAKHHREIADRDTGELFARAGA